MKSLLPKHSLDAVLMYFFICFHLKNRGNIPVPGDVDQWNYCKLYVLDIIDREATLSKRMKDLADITKNRFVEVAEYRLLKSKHDFQTTIQASTPIASSLLTCNRTGN